MQLGALSLHCKATPLAGGAQQPWTSDIYRSKEAADPRRRIATKLPTETRSEEHYGRNTYHIQAASSSSTTQAIKA
jgi:hypothetical protein